MKDASHFPCNKSEIFPRETSGNSPDVSNHKRIDAMSRQFVKSVTEISLYSQALVAKLDHRAGALGGASMPEYEITYRHDDGSLTAKIETQCATDMQAKTLAHAMKVDGARQFEVRQGDTLIYARPQAEPPVPRTGF
jgi:hypothetical protein